MAETHSGDAGLLHLLLAHAGHRASVRGHTGPHLIILVFILWPSESVRAYTLELEASQVPGDPTKVKSAAKGVLPSMQVNIM